MPLPEEAAKSTKASHDLLRRFKELGANMKTHAPPSAIEQDLQVCTDAALWGRNIIVAGDVRRGTNIPLSMLKPRIEIITSSQRHFVLVGSKSSTLSRADLVYL